MSQGDSSGRAREEPSPSHRGPIPSLKRTISGGSRAPISVAIAGGPAMNSNVAPQGRPGSHPSVPVVPGAGPPQMMRAVTSAAAFNRSNPAYVYHEWSDRFLSFVHVVDLRLKPMDSPTHPKARLLRRTGECF